MNLFTPKEEQKVKHLLSTIEQTETVICVESNEQLGRHQWERTDARKRVCAALNAVRRQTESLIRLMDKSDAERLNV